MHKREYFVVYMRYHYTFFVKHDFTNIESYTQKNLVQKALRRSSRAFTSLFAKFGHSEASLFPKVIRIAFRKNLINKTALGFIKKSEQYITCTTHHKHFQNGTQNNMMHYKIKENVLFSIPKYIYQKLCYITIKCKQQQ